MYNVERNIFKEVHAFVDINFNLLSNYTYSTMDMELLKISVVLKRVSSLSNESV